MIPKIIHHVWPGDDPFKEKFHRFRRTWMQHHPDWTFYFWRLDNLPDDIKTIFNNIPNISEYNVTVKSDILRLLVVNKFGGIYVDTDMECLKPHDEFLNLEFFSGYESQDEIICPSLFGAVPKSKVTGHILAKTLKSIKETPIEELNKSPNFSVQVYSKALLDYVDNKMVVVYPTHYFYPVHYTERENIKRDAPDSYAKHWWSGLDADGWQKLLTIEIEY